MSNRFHNKFHRFNHHSAGTPDPKYPDTGYDPIASFDSPFQGEFYSQGDIITTQNLSAGLDLTVGINAAIGNNLTVGYDASIGNDLTVAVDGSFGNNLLVGNDLTVIGNLNVLGTTTQLDTLVYATSALSVTNSGTGPAATITQTGLEDVAVFYDDADTALIIKDGGNVGINTDTPNEKLTVVGNISATGNITIDGTSFLQSISAGGIIQPNTSIVVPEPITNLSNIANDIEFDGQTSSVIISAFSSGTRGVTYTLTNKNTNTVTITASPTLYVRGGNNWYSNQTSNEFSSIVLLSGYSCSLRADTTDVFSVW